MSNDTFAAWLKKQMQRREWNQSDAASRIGVVPSVVSHWVNGTRIPTPESCDRIADAFLVPLDDVLIAAGHKPPQPRLAADDPRAHMAGLAARVRWTPDRQAGIEALFRQWIESDAKPTRSTKD